MLGKMLRLRKNTSILIFASSSTTLCRIFLTLVAESHNNVIVGAESGFLSVYSLSLQGKVRQPFICRIQNLQRGVINCAWKCIFRQEGGYVLQPCDIMFLSRIVLCKHSLIDHSP